MTKINIIPDQDTFLETLKAGAYEKLSLTKTHFNGIDNVEHYTFTEDINKQNSNISGIYDNFQTTFVAPKNAKGFYDNENYSNYPSYMIDSNFNYHSELFEFIEDMGDSFSEEAATNVVTIESKIREEDFLNRIREGVSVNAPENRVCVGFNYNDHKISGFTRKVPLYVGLSIIKPTKNKISSTFDKHKLYESMSSTLSEISLKDENITMIDTDGVEKTLLSIDMEEVISAMYPAGARADKVYLTMHDKLPTTISHLDKIDLIEKLNNLNLNINNFKDLVNNKKAYHEILFYKIEKFQGSRLLQTYLVPPKNNVMNYTDIQVSLGQKYQYVVSCYSAIAGTSYRYQIVKDSTVNGIRKVGFRVFSRPVVKIVKMHIFNEPVTVTGNGPIEPQVRFLNHSNSENKLRIYMDTQEGEEIKKLIPFTSNDRMAPYNRDTKGNVVFSSNNERVKYYVYRMSNKPKRYTDFANRLVSTFEVREAPNSVVMVDKIHFNKKYYYTFRTSSVFGLYSNPTPIYEVELIRDSDETKVIVNVVDIRHKLFQKQRNFKQFMQIVPSVQQTILQNVSDSFHDSIAMEKSPEDLLTDVKIGVAEKSIWGRKFKIRVKSNDTGKTIDFNIKFKLSKIKSEDNFQ